jgi:Fe-S-cluster containining protein
MADESRQQRRKELRERTKQGERLLGNGLSEAPRRPDVLAVAEVFRSKLLERNNDRRATEAATLAHQLAERSLEAHPSRAQIACRKGCGYCCHTFVAILPPEAFRLANAVRAGRAAGLDAAAVSARAARLRGLVPEQRMGAKLPCPLLVDGACSVYSDRPLVCRQTTSLSLPSCIEEFEGLDRDGRVEVSSTHLAHASNAHLAFLGALAAAGLPIVAYELGAALDLALGDPEAERRWLAGEPVFAALAKVERPREVDVIATGVAAALGPR